jgi:hypothetical protein
MVPYDGKELNKLFDELADWNVILQDTNIHKMEFDPEP